MITAAYIVGYISKCAQYMSQMGSVRGGTIQQRFDPSPYTVHAADPTIDTDSSIPYPSVNKPYSERAKDKKRKDRSISSSPMVDMLERNL